MRFQALSLTTPSANAAGAEPATPPDFCFPCNVRYDYSPTPGVTPPSEPSTPTFGGTVRSVTNEATFDSALLAAADGDILEIPAATTVVFTGTKTINKSIEVRGQSKTTSVITTVRKSGTATSGTTSVLTDSLGGIPTPLTSGEYSLVITAGTNAGLQRVISATTNTTITVTASFPSAFNSTSQYQIVRNFAANSGVIVVSGTKTGGALNNNVYFHDFTITSPSNSADHACIRMDTLSSSYFNGASGLRCQNLVINNTEFGVVVAGDSWTIKDCEFNYLPVTGSADNSRHIGIYNIGTIGWIENCVFNCTTEGVARVGAIFLSAADFVFTPGATRSGGYTGNLMIKGCTQPSGNLRQFYNQEVWKANALNSNPMPTAGFSLWAINNTHGNTSGGSFIFYDGNDATNLFFYDAITSGSVPSVGGTLTWSGGAGIVRAVSGTAGVGASGWVAFTLNTGVVPTDNQLVTFTLSSVNYTMTVNGATIDWRRAPLSFFNTLYFSNNSCGESTGTDKGLIAVDGLGVLRSAGAPTNFYVPVANTGTAITTALGGNYDQGCTNNNGSTPAISPPQGNLLAINSVYFNSPSPSSRVPLQSGAAAGPSGLFTVDGVLLLDGYRVFVVDSTSAVNSGIYSATSGAWYRSSDMAAGDDASGDRFTVTQGTTYANTNWVCTNAVGDGIVGTNALTFAAA